MVYLLKSTTSATVCHAEGAGRRGRGRSADGVPCCGFPIADWLERETWDQYGIVFTGHPNLKRLLNHHEFVGHPLRKDYPVQKRQHLSINDPMLDCSRCLPSWAINRTHDHRQRRRVA